MLFLSIKQLFSRLQQTILTLIGLILGTAGYIILSGIMLGFQEYIVNILVNNDAHIKIKPRDEEITPETFRGVFFSDAVVKWVVPPSGITDNTSLINVQGWFEKLEKDFRVQTFSPRLERQVFYKNGSATLPGTIIGINPEQEMRVTTIADFVTQGKLESIGEGESIVVVGEGVLRRLGAKLGSTIQIINASGEIYPVKIKGTVKTGMHQIDESLSYASRSTVRNITNSSGEISSIAIRLYDVSQAAEVATSMSQFSKDKVESWDQANANILGIFRTQNITRMAITMTIILVVAFGIYNILNMVVNQKKKEIAILRSIGYTPGDIVVLFLAQGVILGVVGALLGMVLGFVAVYGISRIEITDGRLMMVSWNGWIYVNGFMLTVVSSVIAGVIPARLAGRLSPIEVIRSSS